MIPVYAGRRRVRLPYALPTEAPYNAPIPAITPTYDGSGQTIHPSVLDFGPSRWRGWRYWQANTPYPYMSEPTENPSILASNDGYTWATPIGLVNPIEPWSGIDRDYNSDTELAYDPEWDRLVCYWRPFNYDRSDSAIMARTSANGVDWSSRISIVDTTHIRAVLSPSVVRRGPGDWWLFAVTRTTAGNGLAIYRSTNPVSGWSLVATPAPLGIAEPWHGDVIWDGSAFRGIVSTIDRSSAFPISSSDGLSWSTGDAALSARAGHWDAGIYRPTLTVASESYYGCWYSGYATGNIARTGYTRLPRSLWPAPPA